MKEPLTLLLAAVVSIGAGMATALGAPKSDARDPGAETESKAELEALRRNVAGALAAQEELSRELDRIGGLAATSPREAVGGVDAAVARWMESHLEERLAQQAANEITPASNMLRTQAAKLVEDLTLGELSWEEQQALWKRIHDEGLLDLVVAEMEKQVAIDPSNPDLQNSMGATYLQKVYEAGVGPAAIEWSAKADKSFDQALEADGEHWEARFNKAVSLSNWPAFLGKSGEAIRQFEILVAQQENGGQKRGGFDQPYQFLGNMYQQIGETEKAKAIWARGMELYPDSRPTFERLTQQDD